MCSGNPLKTHRSSFAQNSGTEYQPARRARYTKYFLTVFVIYHYMHTETL